MHRISKLYKSTLLASCQTCKSKCKIFSLYKMIFHKVICTPMFIALLLTLARICKQSIAPEQMN